MGGRSRPTPSRRGWPRWAWPDAHRGADAASPSRANAPWRRTGYGGSSPRSRRTCCGAATSPRSPPTRASSTSATVIDLHSRRLLGYAMSAHHDAELTVATLGMAAATRGGTVDGLIFHSDRGTGYTAADYAKACRRLGILQSMGRVGCALDNAAAEAFNSSIKVEYIHRQRFRTRAEARIKIATWIVDFYNARRRHSACDGMSPIDYEHFIAEARRAEAA
jgi:transposase InsO family protein